MKSIEQINYIKAPASVVYETLVTEEGLKQIWTKKLSVKPEVGFINEFDFNEDQLTKMKVTDLRKDSKIVWECVDSDPEWVGTGVSFDLVENEGVTAITLKHFDWRETTEYYRWCAYNWAMFLQRLKTYCEGR